jgi:hypothetical protein
MRGKKTEKINELRHAEIAYSFCYGEQFSALDFSEIL